MSDDRLSPEFVHRVAARVRASKPAPNGGMPPGFYVSCEAIHALADALDAVAEEDDSQRDRAEERVRPSDGPDI